MSKFLTLTIFFTAIAQGHSIVTSNDTANITTDHLDNIPVIRNRVLYGDETTIENVPWLVSISMHQKGGWKYRCGGSIISSYFVLSAAHCFENTNPRNYLIRAGSTFLTHGRSTHNVIMITRPRQFRDDRPGAYDIALLEVEEPFELNGVTRRVVKLYSENDPLPEGRFVMVSGWGRTETASRSNVLRFAELPVLDKSRCSEIRDPSYHFNEGTFCAGYEEGGKDACNGDSGGPVTFHERQVGIVSTGPYDCGAPRTPGGYTEVAHYRDWINKNSGV